MLSNIRCCNPSTYVWGMLVNCTKTSITFCSSLKYQYTWAPSVLPSISNTLPWIFILQVLDLLYANFHTDEPMSKTLKIFDGEYIDCNTILNQYDWYHEKTSQELRMLSPSLCIQSSQCNCSHCCSQLSEM